jgi:hypothetical protein
MLKNDNEARVKKPCSVLDTGLFYSDVGSQARTNSDQDINVIPTENLTLRLIDFNWLIFFPFTHKAPSFRLNHEQTVKIMISTADVQIIHH